MQSILVGKGIETTLRAMEGQFRHGTETHVLWISLSTRFNTYKKKAARGVLAEEKQTLQEAQMLDNVILLINSVKETDFVGNEEETDNNDLPQPEMDEAKSKELKLLERKLSFFRQQFATLSDPAQKFQMEIQIEEVEGRIKEIRG